MTSNIISYDLTLVWSMNVRSIQEYSLLTRKNQYFWVQTYIQLLQDNLKQPLSGKEIVNVIYMFTILMDYNK